MSEQAAAAKKEPAKKQTRATRRKGEEPSLNMAEIRELAELVDAHGFTDFEFENENIRIRLSKNPAPQIVQAVQPFPRPCRRLPLKRRRRRKRKRRIPERKPKRKLRRTRIYTK
jgi:hypothetical protein